MKTYEMHYVNDRASFSSLMQTGSWASIDCFPWDCPGHPEAEAMLAYDDTGIYVALRAREKNIRAVVTKQNGPVYTDSCLEFFLNPAPHSQNNYINFECNPCGFMLVEVGEKRGTRKLQTEIDTRTLFRIEALPSLDAYNGSDWSLVYHVPFAFLTDLIPEFDPAAMAPMACNFYKCGDDTAEPHWSCWNPIDLPQPDFHCPAFFGRVEWTKRGE